MEPHQRAGKAFELKVQKISFGLAQHSHSTLAGIVLAVALSLRLLCAALIVIHAIRTSVLCLKPWLIVRVR